jgi:hypothetical protein
MAATVLIKRLIGASPGQASAVDETSGNTRLKQADDAADDANNPVPAAGTLDSNASVSCWGVTQLHCTGAPATGLAGIKWWGDNTALATGLKIRGESATSYIQAVTSGLTFGGAGEAKVANYSTMTAPVDLWNVGATGTYTSGAKKSLSGTLGATTGYIANTFMVLQIQVASTAAAGPTAQRTATYSYDET